jgi:hypothetical protein
MDEALIEHAHEDIDYQDRSHDQERHGDERRLERLRRALELADQGGRGAEARFGRCDGVDGLAQRRALGKVER